MLKKLAWRIDPAKRRKHSLAESSYGSAEKLPEIVLLPSLTAPATALANEWLAANYKEVLGIEIPLNPVESTTYTALTKDSQHHPADVHPRMVRRLSRSSELAFRLLEDRCLCRTHLAIRNPELDEMLNAADKELDPAKRMTVVR